MATAVENPPKTAEDLRREIDELQRQQREVRNPNFSQKKFALPYDSSFFSQLIMLSNIALIDHPGSDCVPRFKI